LTLRSDARLGPRELHPEDTLFGESVRLVGYAADRTPSVTAPVVSLALEFHFERQLAEDYKLFAHLLDASGQTVAQHDIILTDPDGRPTSRIEPGDRVRVELTIRGDAGRIRAGERVGIGLYQATGAGARLPVRPTAPEDRLPLPLSR
jgi:hypothetical protein